MLRSGMGQVLKDIDMKKNIRSDREREGGSEKGNSAASYFSVCRSFGGIRRGVNRPVRKRSAVRGKLGGGFDEGQFAEGNAGLHETITVMGNIARQFPVEIAQVAVSHQTGIVA
jgi:hypothetical protein